MIGKTASVGQSVTVCLISALILGIGINRIDIAGAYADSVSCVRAQDEAVYANSAYRLVNDGNWLTPKFMGRYLLFKPPLLITLSGASIRVFGKSLLALRFPVLLASVLATVLLFRWDARRGWLAAMLLLSNPLWHTFARLCCTDMLLAFFIVLSMTCLMLDPKLQRTRYFWIFATGVAGGILTKSVAGLLPLAVLALFWALLGRRFDLFRFSQLCLVVVVLIAPWHVYQLVVHREWFWAEYVRMQLFAFGLHPPWQYAREPLWLFYGRRLLLTDPLLLAMSVFAIIPLALAAYRRNDSRALLLACWTVVALVALLTFQYRSMPYLLLLIAPLCLMAGLYFPLKSRMHQAIVCAVLIGIFAIKSLNPGRSWGLPLGRVPPIPAASLLRNYAGLARPNELIYESPDDDFYSATLGLHNLHYLFLDRDGSVERSAPHHVFLGIIMTSEQYLNLPLLKAQFAERLRNWGLDSGEPIATTIVAHSDDEIGELIRSLPNSDFLLSRRVWNRLGEVKTHRVSDSSGHVLLLAR